ncbi:MAG: hypothetical protein L0Z62_36880 [Gemmataceae bacterium]|nr:hypothetical protein [Gemmataceae bacterium]
MGGSWAEGSGRFADIVLIVRSRRAASKEIPKFKISGSPVASAEVQLRGLALDLAGAAGGNLATQLAKLPRRRNSQLGKGLRFARSQLGQLATPWSGPATAPPKPGVPPPWAAWFKRVTARGRFCAKC